MLEYLLKTIDGRYINKYMARVNKRMKTFMSTAPFRAINFYADYSKK